MNSGGVKMIKKLKTTKSKKLNSIELKAVKGGCIFACGCNSNCGTTDHSAFMFSASTSNNG
jgi:hypothetical protein